MTKILIFFEINQQNLKIGNNIFMKKLMILDKQRFLLQKWGWYIKAKSVSQGSEEENLDKIHNDSPTCCKENFHVVLLFIVTNKWKIHSLDIKSAFLQDNKTDCEAHWKSPVEAGTSKLWKLNISVYRLCDAPRSWYLNLKSVLLRAGATKRKLDDTIFFISQQ